MDQGSARDPDSFYVQDCRQVQNNTHSIQTLTGQISRLVGTLSSDKDLDRCRSMVDDAVKAAMETRTVLTRVREHQNQAINASERNNRRMMYTKLSDNLAITVRVLEDVVRRFTTEERRYLERQDGSSSQVARSAVAAGDEAGGEEAAVVSTGGGLNLEEEMRDSLQDSLQEDRCRVLVRANQDVHCLQRIYTDLANTAEEQQATFDTLESHLVQAAQDIERGREEIDYAARYGRGRAWLKERMWTLAGGSIAVVVTLSYLTS